MGNLTSRDLIEDKLIVFAQQDFDNQPKHFLSHDHPLVQLLYLFACNIGNIPNISHAFSHLQSIFLQGCNLTSIPEAIADIPELLHLDLSFNALSSLPHLILNFLTDLSLTDNFISHISHDLDKLFPNLKFLALQLNRLTSVLDLSHKRLEQLYLESNLIHEFGGIIHLPELTHLSLFNNNLRTFKIARESNVMRLRHLDLRMNNISFIHGDTFAALPSLQTLFLSKNNLFSLPIHLSFRCPKLRDLDASYNRLSSVPLSLNILQQISSVFMDNNSILSIPPLLNLSTLTRVCLDHNLLCKTPQFGKELGFFSANHNRIRHVDSIQRNSQLVTCSLTHNNLQHFPSNLLTLTLHSLNLNHNFIQSVPLSLARMQSLGTLDLSFNQLDHVPSCIFFLPNLNSLNLSFNRITTVPPWLFVLPNLRSLNLSGNLLTSLPSPLRVLQLAQPFSSIKSSLKTDSDENTQMIFNSSVRRLLSTETPFVSKFVRRSGDIRAKAGSAEDLAKMYGVELDDEALLEEEELEAEAEEKETIECELLCYVCCSNPAPAINNTVIAPLRSIRRSVMPALPGGSPRESRAILNSLPPTSFHMHPFISPLNTLNLNSNFFSFVPPLVSAFPQLSTLWLSDNQITTLQPPIVSSLARIPRLDLSFNLLDSLPEKLVSNSSQYIFFDVSHNLLTQIPEGFIKSTIRRHIPQSQPEQIEVTSQTTTTSLPKQNRERADQSTRVIHSNSYPQLPKRNLAETIVVDSKKLFNIGDVNPFAHNLFFHPPTIRAPFFSEALSTLRTTVAPVPTLVSLLNHQKQVVFRSQHEALVSIGLNPVSLISSHMSPSTQFQISRRSLSLRSFYSINHGSLNRTTPLVHHTNPFPFNVINRAVADHIRPIFPEYPDFYIPSPVGSAIWHALRGRRTTAYAKDVPVVSDSSSQSDQSLLLIRHKPLFLESISFVDFSFNAIGTLADDHFRKRTSTELQPAALKDCYSPLSLDVITEFLKDPTFVPLFHLVLSHSTETLHRCLSSTMVHAHNRPHSVFGPIPLYRIFISPNSQGLFAQYIQHIQHNLDAPIPHLYSDVSSGSSAFALSIEAPQTMFSNIQPPPASQPMRMPWTEKRRPLPSSTASCSVCFPSISTQPLEDTAPLSPHTPTKQSLFSRIRSKLSSFISPHATSEGPSARDQEIMILHSDGSEFMMTAECSYCRQQIPVPSLDRHEAQCKLTYPDGFDGNEFENALIAQVEEQSKTELFGISEDLQLQIQLSDAHQPSEPPRSVGKPPTLGLRRVRSAPSLLSSSTLSPLPTPSATGRPFPATPALSPESSPQWREEERLEVPESFVSPSFMHTSLSNPPKQATNTVPLSLHHHSCSVAETCGLRPQMEDNVLLIPCLGWDLDGLIRDKQYSIICLLLQYPPELRFSVSGSKRLHKECLALWRQANPQTGPKTCPYFSSDSGGTGIFGIIDGHGTIAASNYIASRFVPAFLSTCHLHFSRPQSQKEGLATRSSSHQSSYQEQSSPNGSFSTLPSSSTQPKLSSIKLSSSIQEQLFPNSLHLTNSPISAAPKNATPPPLSVILTDTLSLIQEELVQDRVMGGACVCIAIVTKDHVHTANIGDSRAVMVSRFFDHTLQQAQESHEQNASSAFCPTRLSKQWISGKTQHSTAPSTMAPQAITSIPFLEDCDDSLIGIPPPSLSLRPFSFTPSPHTFVAARNLSSDHTSLRHSERLDILSRHSYVTPDGRVCGNLAPSRVMGDVDYVEMMRTDADVFCERVRRWKGIHLDSAPEPPKVHCTIVDTSGNDDLIERVPTPPPGPQTVSNPTAFTLLHQTECVPDSVLPLLDEYLKDPFPVNLPRHERAPHIQRAFLPDAEMILSSKEVPPIRREYLPPFRNQKNTQLSTLPSPLLARNPPFFLSSIDRQSSRSQCLWQREDVAIVIGCDGIFDVLDAQDVAELVCPWMDSSGSRFAFSPIFKRMKVMSHFPTAVDDQTVNHPSKCCCHAFDRGILAELAATRLKNAAVALESTDNISIFMNPDQPSTAPLFEIKVGKKLRCFNKFENRYLTCEVLEARGETNRQFYVHFDNLNRRMDAWVDEKDFDSSWVGEWAPQKKKDKKDASIDSTDQRPTSSNVAKVQGTGQNTVLLFEPKPRNIEKIIFGCYEIEAWYYSPFYPDLLDQYGYASALYICDSCLIPFNNERSYRRHCLKCRTVCPPGNEIFRQDSVSMFEVDGEKEKEFCRNLSLISKLFLDHKTLAYDVTPFWFFVLAEREADGFHIVGYFSKEKESKKQFNLSCIMVLPPFHQKGYGRFLITISYELSKRENLIGSPEEPLSDLGYLSYLSFWKYQLLEVLLASKRPLSINELSHLTFIKPHQIRQALTHYHLIKYSHGEYVLYLPPEVVEEHRRKKPKIIVDTNRIHWTPPIREGGKKGD
ncbi:putative Histone acetyltransferase KAT8 [Blattamonas nauphoetae]|uniref:histone acetyltransferase n=1 Tax=Blattamonas nauphoetae TaxID=2049346 RepID=A0ABQ9XHC9_9EUKA|nr:putative Histone acetyltransferase KAT8 [Blattamonas nauphoetae]